MAAAPRVYEFDVIVGPDRAARSALGGTPIPREEAWWAEHLVLAGLVRCTFASLDHHARRNELAASGTGSAHGVVTKRVEDGRYALVEVDVRLDVELAPDPDAAELPDLLARVERGCFVGNSLTAPPRYRWTVNGHEVTAA